MAEGVAMFHTLAASAGNFFLIFSYARKPNTQAAGA
jgi:hypothetical protein